MLVFRVFILSNCLPVRCLSAPACAACTADWQTGVFHTDVGVRDRDFGEPATSSVGPDKGLAE